MSAEEWMKARIIKIVSKDYQIVLEDGRCVDAIVMGRVRLQDTPVVGDEVEALEQSGRWGIVQILPRRTFLRRPACANVDQALIVMSVKDPDFSTVLIDRLSFLIVHAGITPVLCVTKCDLGFDEAVEKSIKEYEQGPMQVLKTAKDSLDPSLAGVLKGKVTVLTGQSGAGKSTLLNSLNPSFHLATQQISKALGRGKHTTRHCQLYEVAGGFVADTPGFSSLDFSQITKEELGACVLDFEPYLGMCRFKDCVHQNEPGCAVKQAVQDGKIPMSRYHSYLEVLQMIQMRKEKY